MSAPQNFRSAFNGFNREDVVRYLEYINAKHTAQVNQLNSENDYLRSKLEHSQADAELIQQRDALLARVEELEKRCAELEQLSQPQAEPTVVEEVTQEPLLHYSASEELEAYRRAERTERIARERAELVYHQVNGILADATAKVDGVASEIGTVAEQVMPLLYQLQAAVSGSKQTLQDAASTMYAIKPNN